MAKENGESSEGQLSSEPAALPNVIDSDNKTTPEPVESGDGPSPHASSTTPGGDVEAAVNSASKAAVSQPMTASNSSSSNPPSKENGMGTASPYGTRSRNRAGASRPNYAEDREMELEFEVQPAAKEEEARRAVRATETPASNVPTTTPAVAAARRAPSTSSMAENTLPPTNTPKDQIPGTSTFSANPATSVSSQPSKKRKAQPAPSTAITSQTTPGPSTSSQTAMNKVANSSQVMAGIRESFMLSFDTCGGRLADGKLVADDGTVLGLNDHVYLVCEPPGEPYYLGRIMEFLHVNNEPDNPIDALRMNWYYRPKDIGRKVNDTRQVFASMHSDISPLTSLRGTCQIMHKSEIQNLDEFRRTQNCFWYEKLYDRYIHRYYEVIPTNQVVNVPKRVKKVLDDRWKFILVESGRGKELTSAVKSCKRCSGYCASTNSVDCAVCRQTYHMNCVRPPLLKKPSRGFAWACGPCSRAQERKLEARNTPNLAETGVDAEDEDMIDEEDDEAHLGEGAGTGRTSPVPSVDEDIAVHPGTAEQIYQASLWPFRYLGVHCKVEDCLDYDDRIYPRASSRLGPRHQADVPLWYGRPVELVKPADIRKRYMRGGGHKKEPKLSKESVAALEADKTAREKRPKWVTDEPVGYIRRGEDLNNDDPNNTAKLLFKPRQLDSLDASAVAEEDNLIEHYMQKASALGPTKGLSEFSVNFMDKAIQLLNNANFNEDVAIENLSNVQKSDLKEPELTAAELKKFEDAVAKYGSELHSVKKHVKTVSAANIVRFYYTWKKTERGKQVWGNYSGRKGKKEAKKAEVNVGKLQDDIADDHDDSAFDNDKAIIAKRGFQCKFCSTHRSRQWRRAPNTPAGTVVQADPANKVSGKDKGSQLTVALCINCAVVWRRYAVQWEDVEDHRKNAQGGGRATKRKVDDSYREFQLSEMSYTASNTDVATTPTGGTPMPQTAGLPSIVEPVRKKAKNASEKELTDPINFDAGGVVTAGQQKKKPVEKPIGPPSVPELPKPRLLPCSVCSQMDPLGDQHVSCANCRMTVHRNCYGIIGETRGVSKWLCDLCSNDRNPQLAVIYKCVLCPIDHREHDFVEPPKATHKKKSEKEREKDRIEREAAQKIADYYRKKQVELNRPVNPREPLKRTLNNNWVHVTCAVWTPEIKFGNAKALEPSEGISAIPVARHDEICKICKQDRGACVPCHSCRAPVHIECAHQNGYILGFDIAPVKGSRRDQFNIVNINGEAGIMTAAIWCKEHVPTKTIVHRMHDIVDETGLNALQLYVRTFKQADLTLTGTVRKATLINQSAKAVMSSAATAAVAPNRRTSTATPATSNGNRGSLSNIKIEDNPGPSTLDLLTSPSPVDKTGQCVTCGVDTSPKWWPYEDEIAVKSKSMTTDQSIDDARQSDQALTNGHTHSGSPEPPKRHEALAAAALKEDPEKGGKGSSEVQCHKCHHKRVRKREPSPPRPAISRHDVQLSQPITSTTIPGPALSPPILQAASQFAWPAQTAYSPTSRYNDWQRPSPSSTQPVATNHQYNGMRSPRSNPNQGHALLNQSQVRQSPVVISHSPHINGPMAQQGMNGYPPSPHRNLPSGHPIQNGSPYPSYASTRLPPQHLTNGGPPPRAPENPFSHNGHSIHRHASFGPSHNSPPVSRDMPPLNRESISQGHPPRSSDGRVNGGASASPSLRNLLS